MNETIITTTALSLKIKDEQVRSVLSLLEEGATVPFIARYRKEKTGGLNEDQIREIDQVYHYEVNLLKRKEDVIRLIEEKGMMNENLKKDIMQAKKLTDVEDYYRPYKEKKKTKATVAKSKGLEPLAKWILSLPRTGTLEEEATKYIREDFTLQEAIKGALDIIAEDLAERPKYRQYIKDFALKNSTIETKVKKDHPDENHVYEMYYDYSESIRRIADHRVLAINRAEKEKVLTVNINWDDQRCIDYMIRGVIWQKQTIAEKAIREAAEDGYKRLVKPSIVREIRSELTEKAEDASLKLFSLNLEKLLLQPPMKDRYVLGLDPAYRTGCKLAALDPTGKVLEINKVFITLPKDNYKRDEDILLRMIRQHHIELIAIGNGTASRESEAFIANLIKKYKLNVQYTIVSEAGASVYSAGKIAQQEFPDYQVEERSAVSIGRRLQDPLAELVKIEPQAISVGQYQHDMNHKKLTEQLNFVVEKVVNQVGVNINTASPSLLQYVSGLTATTSQNIINYRNEHGSFQNRRELMKVPKLGPKSYEQAIGFLRIMGGANRLDETPIHPDNYDDARRLLATLHLNLGDLGTDKMKDVIKTVNHRQLLEQLSIDHYLLDDLLDAFVSPHRTPRDEHAAPILKSDILTIEDLKEGMKLEGTVRNVVDFGAFVDIGLKNDGLVHISKMSYRRIKHPTEVVNVGDIVDVYVAGVDLKRKRVSLSMIQEY